VVSKTGKMGLRQFAEFLGCSHPTVRSIMQALEISGEAQGPGKPTLLDEQDQARLRAEYFRRYPERSPEVLTAELVPADSDLNKLIAQGPEHVNGNALDVVGWTDINEIPTSDLMRLATTQAENNLHLRDALAQRLRESEAEADQLRVTTVRLKSSNDELEESLIKAAAKRGSLEKEVQSSKDGLLNELVRERSLPKSQ